MRKVRHRQNAGTSCQVCSTALMPKGLVSCTIGKLVGMVRTCRIETIRSQVLTSTFACLLFFTVMCFFCECEFGEYGCSSQIRCRWVIRFVSLSSLFTERRKCELTDFGLRYDRPHTRVVKFQIAKGVSSRGMITMG
jgi:hypothetical protein